MSNRWRVGGGEAQADAHQTLATPLLKGNHHVTTPWRNIFNGSMGYGYTVFYSIVADDPNWGYWWFACLPSGAAEHSIMQITARVGQQRGMFKDGIRGFGDMMGDYGARLATFDCELGAMFREAYFAPARSWLEPVDRAEGICRIPMEEAPEPYGVNIVRLVADTDGDEIAVEFTGLYDPDFYSDWRACIVAVGADGRSRYSVLWNKGRMALARRPGDVSYWLTVAATPTAIYSDSSGGRDLTQAVYSGRYAYRYPWSVRLTGARPGTPRECRADFNDVALKCTLDDPVPAPHDTAGGKAYLAKLEAFAEALGDGGEAASLKSRIEEEIARMTEGRRHANGGGWVVDTAEVAPTAYVGPDAMVLGRAKVLDRAIVEDYAIVTDDAVVSGHARISGQAIVKGAARAGGYSRVWHVLTQEATVVPKRLGASALDRAGLWANYAMDRDEKTVLADWYRFAHGADERYGMRLGVNLDGHLIGRPEFVVDGERRGFHFDGKTQHGELCPRVADLGEMTVDLGIKWMGTGPQTILDFGTSTNNCLVLRTDGDARPELVATVDGEPVARVAAKRALPAGEWVDLRIEMDGKRASLWVAGQKAGVTATRFRPCDVFPGGQAKRNFVAAARDGSGGFKGIIDRIVVYHTVHEDFSKVLAPVLDAPTRPTAAYIATLAERLGNIAEVNARVTALSQKMLAPYYQMKEQCEARQKELLERDPGYRKAVDDLAAAKQAIEKRKRELNEEFSKLPENVERQAEVDAARRTREDLRRKVQAMERERFQADGELKALEARREEAAARRRAADKEVRRAFEQQPDVIKERAAIAELRKQIDELAREVRVLEKKVPAEDAELTALHARQKESADKQRAAERALNERCQKLLTSNAECARAEAMWREIDSEIRDRQKALRGELHASEPIIREQEQAGQKYRTLERALRGKRDVYAANGAADANRRAAEAEKALKEATAKAWLRYEPEHAWLYSFEKQGYHGYYNTGYTHYIPTRAKAIIGGGEMREDLDTLKALAEAVSSGRDWHTSVDWDWRLSQEIDGRIKDLPLMRKWLERVRGR